MEAERELVVLAGWITSIVLGLAGLGFSSLGWFVRGRQARHLAIQKDIHDSIDRVVKALTDYEDSVFEFWSDQDSKIRLDQLITLHRRCVWYLNQLSHLRPFAMPNPEIADMRRYATLDAESTQRPEKGSSRLRRFNRATTTILNSSFLRKTWSF